MTLWACGDTSKEQLEAAGLAKGCALSSDCKSPLICVFQLCHDECADTADCLHTYGKDSGARCVSKGDSVSSSSDGGGGGQESSSGKHGVCTFPEKVIEANQGTKGIDSSCKTAKDCPGAEQCGSDGQCRDGCLANSDCIGGQICANSGDCADTTEVDSSGNLENGAAGAGTGGTTSTGGTGGKGGTGGSSGKGGTVEGGAGAGDTIVNECPDTSTMDPVEHDYETIMAPQTWTGLHHITTGLTVNAALTLSPCAVLKFDTNGFIVVNNNGAIKALGTDTNPVVFTSDKTSPKKGDWGGIDIARDASNDSTFKNVIVEYSGSSYIYSQNGIQLEAEASASFQNVLVRNNGDGYCAIGLDAGSEPQAFENVRIESSVKGLCVGSDVVGSIGSVTSDVPISVDTTAVTNDATWQDFGVPYRMGGTLTVNAKLTLAAGVTIQLPANGNVNVDNMGSLVTLGTADKPVTFTSAKAKPLAGDWGYVYFGQNAGNETQLTNTIIEYGGANYYAVNVANNATAGFDTVTISDVGDGSDQICGIEIETGAVISQFDNVTFKNSPCPIKLPSTEVGSLGSLSSDGGNIQVSDTTIAKKTTWKNFGIPYELNGTMYVQQALTLEPGVNVLLQKNTEIIVNNNGSINATGTAKEHISFDSALEGAMAGDWYYIDFASNAAGTSTFSYTDFVHGGGQTTYGALYIDGRSVQFDNCSFTENLNCDYTVTTATGSTFNDGGGNTSDNDKGAGGPYQCGT
jgi:hypothetical protein